jgi:hypothetical protein
MRWIPLMLLWMLWSVLPAFSQEACVPQVTTKQRVTLSWTAPLPGLPVHEYRLEQQEDGGAWKPLPAPATSATSQRVEGLAIGHTYVWRLATVGHEPDGSLVVSGYATHGARPPCVSVIVIAPPTDFTATPE